MSKKINHWCVVCGRGYHACDTCNETKSFTPWRAFTDTIEHFKIFVIIRDYKNNMITKNEAKKKLLNINLSDKDSFKDNSKEIIDEILKEDFVERKAFKKKYDEVKVNNVEKDTEEISFTDKTDN